jgi:hypothetical protein
MMKATLMVNQTKKAVISGIIKTNGIKNRHKKVLKTWNNFLFISFLVFSMLHPHV